jgi:hypothetical protein
MRIESSNVQLAASHQHSQRLDVSERLELWVGQRNPQGRPAQAAAAPEVMLSDAGRRQLRTEDASAVEDSRAAAENDPRLRLLRTIIELMTGKEIKVLEADDLAGDPNTAASAQTAGAAPQAGYGVAYDYHARYEEYQRVDFSAEGEVRTADGDTLRFQVSFSLERSYSEEVNVSLRMGDAAKKDPLVLDIPGSTASLSSARFRFDLDGDGRAESLPGLTGGLGFLVFDRNGNGKIESGKELFGPATNDGFAELAALDGDGNGWIDEADGAFSRLGVWQPVDGSEGSLQSLSESGVGALFLGRVGTPFEIRDSANESLGAVRTSGVYLNEDGSAGTLRQIDLSV